MSAEEQLNIMGDFVEGCINDYADGLADMEETVVKVVEYFVEIFFRMANERDRAVRKELDFFGENSDMYEEGGDEK